MSDIWSMVGAITLGISPIFGALLIIFAIVVVAQRRDDRVYRERKRQAFLLELQKSDLKKAIADRARGQAPSKAG